MREAVIKKSNQLCYVVGALVLQEATADEPAKIDKNYMRVLMRKLSTKIAFVQAQAAQTVWHEQLVRTENLTYAAKARELAAAI